MNKLLLSVFVMHAAVGCVRSTPPNYAPIASPSGKSMLTASITRSKDNTKDRCVAFEVVDSTGTEVCRVQTGASDTMKWAVGWYDEQTIVLSSSDIGTRAWKLVDRQVVELPMPLPSALVRRGRELRTGDALPGKLRFPDPSVGHWVEKFGPAETDIRLDGARFYPMQPIPAEGYAPLEALGPTVRVTVNNSTDFYVADIKVRIQATDSQGTLLAEEVVATPGRYVLIPPAASGEQTYVLDAPQSKFLDSEKWDGFVVSVEPTAARLVSDAELEASTLPGKR